MQTNLHRSAFASVIERLLAKYLPSALEESVYPDRLFCQAILEAPDSEVEVIRKAREQVIHHVHLRSSYFENGPFNHLSHAMFLQTGRSEWWDLFEKFALRVLENPCSPEGAWMHPRGRLGPGFAVLLDSFQEEAVCLLLLAKGIREEDSERAEHLEAQAVHQFRLHRNILRNPDTGLWHNGRGWISGDSSALSPGAWSRGHGWLLRGCVAAWAALADGSRRSEIEGLIQETVETLLPLRTSKDGWPVLLNRAGEASPPETSGTAMICTAIVKADRMGIYLPDGAIEAGWKGMKMLLENCVDAEGEVSGVCDGPGPLVDESSYRGPSFPEDPSHGAFAVLEACLEGVAVLSPPRWFCVGSPE